MTPRQTAANSRVVTVLFVVLICVIVCVRFSLWRDGSPSDASVQDADDPVLPGFGRDRHVSVTNKTALSGHEILSKPFARRIIISERSRLIYCPVPKVASSSWKYLVRKFEGLDDYFDLSMAHSPATSGLRYLTDYSPREIEALLEDPSFFKFVFLRDPYLRAASCYLDKFQNREDSYVRKEYPAFLAQLYDWRYVRSLNIDTAPRPSFAEFVDELAKQNPMTMNDHWMPQTLLCGLGEMPFDFVGHLESLPEDAQHVLRSLGRPDERFPTQNEIGFPSSGASSGAADEFFTLEAMAKLRLIYDVDFILNDYS